MFSQKRRKDKTSFLDQLKFETNLDDVIMLNYASITGNRIPAFHFVNSYSLALANKSEKYMLILSNGFLICDGKPLSKYLSHSRRSTISNIRGADFLRFSLSEMDSSTNHFFLGSTDKVLNALLSKAREINPSITIVGAHSPKYVSDYQPYLSEWVKLISDSKSNCVWVGLGTPKQDYVAHEIAVRLNVRVFAVGAAFSYVAETEKEAPSILRSLYLEWLYRFFKEPKRLFSRYFWGNFAFLNIILMDFVSKKRWIKE